MASDEWGISSTEGYYKPNLLEIIDDATVDLKNTFGNTVNVGDNSYLMQLIKMQAGREFKVWEMGESVYSSQTKNGAEGIFQDEMYAYQGVLREGSTFGTGNIVVETDATSSDIAEIAIGTTFGSTIGIQYTSETSRTMSDYVRGYKIDDDTLEVGTYSFTITNSNNITTTGSAALISNSDVDRLIFFNNLYTLFSTVLPDDVDSILISEVEGETAFYVGFSEYEDEYSLIGVSEVFKLKFTAARIGNRFSETSTTATETGYNPLAANNIISMIPVPTGYISVTNIDNFFSGADTETDAAYSVRAEAQSDAPTTSTSPAILSALLDLDSVVGASLNKEVDPTTGRVTVEPILFGGETEDIAQTLYNTQPINNQYSGEVSYVVTTDDGKTETIKFSRGVDLNMSVRVLYTPVNGIPLSTLEISSIKTSVAAVNSNITVGGTVFSGQLSGAVFDVSPQRFRALSIETKLESADDSAYSTDDYTPLARELPRLSVDRIEIVQVN